MKKIAILLISLFFLGTSYAQDAQDAHETFYFNNGTWKDASGTPQAGIPNKDSYDDIFIVQTGTYTSNGGEDVYEIKVEAGATFEVNGYFNVEHKLTTLGSSPNVHINPDAELDLTAGTIDLQSVVLYADESSTFTIGRAPSPTVFSRLNPALLGRGTVIFNKKNQHYSVGFLSFIENVNYEFSQPNITLIASTVTVERDVDLEQRNFTIQGNLTILPQKKLRLRSTATSNKITGDVTI